MLDLTVRGRTRDGSRRPPDETEGVETMAGYIERLQKIQGELDKRIESIGAKDNPSEEEEEVAEAYQEASDALTEAIDALEALR